MKVAGDKRQLAVAYAMRTTGTVLVCGVGVYSGDGKRAFDPRRSWDIAEETKRFLRAQCRPFTGEEMAQVAARCAHQEQRARRLAKLALDAGKYDAARKLCYIAEHAGDRRIEIGKRKARLYRILKTEKETE